MTTQTMNGKTMAMTMHAPRPTLSEHLAAKQAKQATRQRAREDRMILRARRA